jgi:hypothetical protein
MTGWAHDKCAAAGDPFVIRWTDTGGEACPGT